MEWIHETWTIKELLELYKEGKIILSPDYQRNDIWTSKAQKKLIDTILKPQPLPNFFLLKKNDDEYEMVDGQQRSRTIIGFSKGQILSSNGENIDSIDEELFLNYPLDITLINKLSDDEVIEDYYALVNSSGLRLSTPELRKAKYYDTKFLELSSTLAKSKPFSEFGFFSSGTKIRMNDIELVSELLALLHFGISERKDKLDQLFEDDISLEESKILKDRFDSVVFVLYKLNSYSPLKKTRFRQRADLYTLFNFIHENKNLSQNTFLEYYKILFEIALDISPSQEMCEPLRDYARNCVSQSNSEKARKARNQFLNDLLMNPDKSPNPTQEAIIKYYKLTDKLIEIEETWTVDYSQFKENDRHAV